MSEPVSLAEALREWANGVDRLALAKMAEDMPKVREARKPQIIDWLLANDRDRLAESYQIESTALGYNRRRPHGAGEMGGSMSENQTDGVPVPDPAPQPDEAPPSAPPSVEDA